MGEPVDIKESIKRLPSMAKKWINSLYVQSLQLEEAIITH